jgi:hypothetical protein
MKQPKTTLLGLAVVASLLVPLTDANAWVAAGGYRGFGGYHGAVAVGGYHGGAYYHGGGCYGCGAAGLAVGMMAGAAIASASHPATVVVQQPATVVVQQPAYVVQGNLPIGTQVASLPPGSSSMVVNGTNYYQSGPTWYKPYFGSSGVYYEVVPTP